jgi:uncharacterized protein involved in response to NO
MPDRKDSGAIRERQTATSDAGRRASVRIAGNAIFFPAAALYAVFVLPASVLAMTGETAAFPALSTPGGHAHEMLFGYALGVVAGNQLGPMALPRIATLAAFWMLARVAFLVAPQSLASAAFNIAFALLLSAHIVPRLVRAAKKLRNQALPLVLVAICMSSVAFQLASPSSAAAQLHTIPIVAVVLFAMLMLFMGGRIIAPTVAGQFYRQGRKLEARVQPRIEAALLVVMTIAAGASAMRAHRLFLFVAAAATIVAGGIAAVRIVRWRLWALRGRPDLVCLAAGYAWLALGLVLYGLALVAGRYETAALHVITVGSLGTLTINVMAMTWTLKVRLPPSRASLNIAATLLIAGATLARVLAAVDLDDRTSWLLAASLCWSSAFALLLVHLARVRKVR